ncbi:T9SS-dependent choice-of-anchor J family protein [Mongoliitalea daihaiensis]|uniref:T9SS-dependent choice-of-anchor J family protein n=1 Tax=Mongoliitalea daihaiensis TaxID=2782006 RepID=UPI001F441599|nr:choice-of-anchor J domain-containing protein [Mongoliitalea daihaiensis]UJP64555.1 choice-of-anchor J domain-containing protein [Mongoliitalea daihaiensis]
MSQTKTPLNYLKRVFLFLVFFAFSNLTYSQAFFGKAFQHVHDEQCGHKYMEALLEEKLGVYGSKEYFESWLQEKKELRDNNLESLRTQNQIKKIPVVVHVIHSGTAEGVGANIPFGQIESQIRTLNEDFRRQNEDRNQTPGQFQPVAADTGIEFVLAKQDPNGLPTTGIIRVQGPQTTYSPNDASLISQISSWPPEEYLNIWVVQLASPVIGYAVFPISNLPGLNFPPGIRELDGITVDFRYFGTGFNTVSSSRGRTATHEVGHFLGLRHIWGDGDCSVDDFVTDTPLQDGPNNICRTLNPRITCDTRDMVENYMDYTTDICMNLFTQGQSERMNIVLENSPRRASLVNSRATLEPELLENDLSLRAIIEPQDFICDPVTLPRLVILNTGSNTVSSAQVEIKLNNQVVESRTFSLDLATGDFDTLQFNSLQLAGTGNLFEATILLVNGQQDSDPSNNSLTSSPVLQGQISLPYNLRMEDVGNSWVVRNPDDSFTWEVVNNQFIDGSNRQLLRVRNYEYDANGQLDFLISPQINLAESPNAQLVFRMAHAPFNAPGFSDALYVALSTDCGNTFSIIDAPYAKNVQFLQTVNPILDEFIANSDAQFRTEIVNLAPFADLGNVRIAFINQNGFGNNIFLQDIQILTEETFRYRVEIPNLVTPAPISNNNYENEQIEITNTGNLPVTGFILRRRYGNTPQNSFLFRGQIAPGGSALLNLPKTTLGGVNNFQFTIDNPSFDQNPGNSTNLSRFVVFDTETQRTPWRQNFNNIVSLSPWVTINPENNRAAWTLTPVQNAPNSNVVRVQATEQGNSFWLGTPIFELNKSPQASIFFDRAAGPMPATARLRVLASENGGGTYSEVLSLRGSEISTVTTGEPNPNNQSDFARTFINLSDFAGRGKTTTRVAIVMDGINPEDGPIYLNNAELFISANPEPVDPGLGNSILYPNPARDQFNIAFNLRNFETINIKMISPTGALVHDVDYPNTLNQTYTFTTKMLSKGLFIIQISSPTITETKKLYIH